jgi:putative nucleotidyltransferase with HDIG domain
MVPESFRYQDGINVVGLGGERGSTLIMRLTTNRYVAGVALAALTWSAALFWFVPTSHPPAVIDIALLAGLAFAAEALSVLLPRSATGSMAFIPYLALLLIVPGWQSVAAVVAVRALVEVRGKRALKKQIFNTAAHALMEASAITAYLALGGVSFLELSGVTHVANVTRLVGGPALIAASIGLLMNNFLVTGAVALSSGRSVRSVWVENNRATAGVDLLATPLVFVFAWVYAAFGVIFTATLWIPIMGLRQLQRVNLELEKTNQELLELMVKSLEARDPYTSGHSRRVAHYSLTIARAIGIGERESERIGRAALLHDVGKIHEKYASVLSKTDKLSPEEWGLIQEHSADGAALVATMTHLSDIVLSVRHHHENWDGTGYPDRLAGELIPVASRIIRFADTIDAMTTERPYRGPMSEPEVRAEIVRCRGTQFDPIISDRLLSSALWSSLFSSPAIGSVEPQRHRLAVIAPKRRAAVSDHGRTASGA